jgi:hypothetical protein
MRIKVKFRFPEIFFGMLLAVAVFALGASFYSERIPNNGSPNSNTNQTSQQNAAPVTNWDIFGIVLAPADILSALLVAATIGLGWITARGIRNQSRETRILQRAYISVEPGGISADVWNPIDDVVAHIGIKNSGHLPARHVAWKTHCEFSDAEHRGTFPETGKVYGGSNIITAAVTMTQGSEPLRYEDKWRYIYVWGRITYTDGFNQNRWLIYCHRYNCRRFEIGYDGLWGLFLSSPSLPCQTVPIHGTFYLCQVPHNRP